MPNFRSDSVNPAGFRPCIVIPTYNNPLTIRSTVQRCRGYLEAIIVVDDGSTAPGAQACQDIARDGLATVSVRAQNGGKGAAVKTGLAQAQELGYTHAFQIDADGQHDLDAIPRFLQAAQEAPETLVLGYPEYQKENHSKVRGFARRFTNFWVNLEADHKIRDAMIGFRVYPLSATRSLRVRGNRMDFDIEIAVRLAWAGVPILNLPVKVRYLPAEEGGVSHFQYLRDNLRFARLHSRLCTAKAMRLVRGALQLRR